MERDGFSLDPHRATLGTEHPTAGRSGPVRENREANISWIRGLPRDDLTHGELERQIEMVRTDHGERLFIQYPGKEATRDDDGRRPWDFRPKVLLRDGDEGDDLSFGDVWDTLFEELYALGEDGVEPARALASLFYRMAFMVDHSREHAPVLRTRLVGDGVARGFEEVEHRGLLRYRVPGEVLEDLSSVLPRMGGMSLEAFLHYNDLMAWNEDCKYYYRDTVVRGEDWDGGRTGRINNLLTHVSIIGVITDDLRLSKLLNKFQRQRGVAPVTRTDSEAITDGILG